MVWRPILPVLRLGIGLCGVLAVIALLPAAAHSQDRSMAERLDRIERDLNMLQRQVYRGAPQSMVAPGDPAAAAGVEVRMERIEAEMRELTGRVETVMNGLDQLKQRVEQINSDIDVRLGQTASTAPGAAPPARPGNSSTRVAGPVAPGTVVPGPTGGLNPIFNTLTPPGSAPPAASPAPEPASTGGTLPSGPASEQFNYAFGLVKQADYPAAEAALKTFIQQHPKDPLAANAQFWLGETFYVRNQFQEAAATFAEGYKRYPRGAKAAENLLKLGMSLARADQKKNACVAFAQLDREFPNSGAAIRERSNVEKKRIGCT